MTSFLEAVKNQHVQTALATIDAFTLGGATGTDDQDASEVATDVSSFGHNLSSTDTTVQQALDTLDESTPFRGDWAAGTYPAGDIVLREGIDYISLVNNNQEVPRPGAVNWSGLAAGYSYRGTAPTVSSNYNFGHLVFDPDTDSYWVFTSTTSASVARADIPTHTNFHELSHFLTNDEATDDSDTTHGTVSGRLLSRAIDANDRVCPDPSTGTAGQVCSVNTATDAYELADGGAGGTGDITAVTTANNSGLAGGVTTGAADLSLDVANLQAVTSVAVGDLVAIQDLTNSGATRKVTLDDVFTTFASTGIGALAGGGHFLDLTEIVTITALAAGDEVVLSDDSNSDVARRSTLTTLGAFLADGTTITASSGVLSSVSGGATITDTDIAEDATTESTTGGASRQAIAEMRDGERHIRYHTTLPEAVDIPDDQHDDIHVLLDSDGNAISLYHFALVEETEEWRLTVGVGLGIRGFAAGVATGYGHISPNGPSIGFTALNRGTTGRFVLVYDHATTGFVRADSRTLYIRQRGTSGNWHVVQMDEIATPYAYESTTSGHNFTFREGTTYNVIVRRAADTNDGGNITEVLTTNRDIAFDEGASLVQLADVDDLLHIGEIVEVVYEQVAGLAAAEVAVDASAFTGNLSATDTDAQTALETLDDLNVGDITGITTSDTSGLSGGCTTGNCILNFSAARLPDGSAFDHDDRVLVADPSGVAASVTLSKFLGEIAGPGVRVEGNNLEVYQQEFDKISPFESGDYLCGLNEDDSNNGACFLAEHVREYAVTVDASAFAGNLSATDTDVQTALETLDDLSVGGTASAEPVAYLARAAVDVSSAFAELTLTTALTDGYMLAFDVDSGTGNTVGGRVLVPSTLLRALPAFSAAPADTTDVEDAYIAPIARVTLTSIITQGLSYVSIWYKDDTHLWIIDSRQEMTAVAISGYPMSGGAALSETQQIGVRAPISLTSLDNILLDADGTGTSWATQFPQGATFPAVPQDQIDHIRVGVSVSDDYRAEIYLPGEEIRRMDSVDTASVIPDDPMDETILPAFYWSARISFNHNLVGHAVARPLWSYANGKRDAGVNGMLIYFDKNDEDEVRKISFLPASGIPYQIEYLHLYYGEAPA